MMICWLCLMLMRSQVATQLIFWGGATTYLQFFIFDSGTIYILLSFLLTIRAGELLFIVIRLARQDMHIIDKRMTSWQIRDGTAVFASDISASSYLRWKLIVTVTEWGSLITSIHQGFRMWSAREGTYSTCCRRSTLSRQSLGSWGQYLIRIQLFIFLLIFYRMQRNINFCCLGTVSESVASFDVRPDACALMDLQTVLLMWTNHSLDWNDNN